MPKFLSAFALGLVSRVVSPPESIGRPVDRIPRPLMPLDRALLAVAVLVLLVAILAPVARERHSVLSRVPVQDQEAP
jgi:hypothetical protein